MIIGQVEELERPTGARRAQRGQVAAVTWSDVAYLLWVQHPVYNFREPERPRQSEVGTSRAKSMKCEGSHSDVPERGGEPAVELERPTGGGSRTRAQDLYLVDFSCFAGPSQTCF
ncbi:hypothetical protein F2Q69_00034346 [Brassica cretica]|uniref:Uncharacterized protein n=1 Tax=Brassica cretica TaxID=69181 RepID=A0A8S9SS09_BRACR|nr:hypothetical protein F2Q69_00034346 [Brassica cretica]